MFEYDGFNMLWEHATGIDGGNYSRTEGIAFIGNNGTLVVNRGGWEVLPETTETTDSAGTGWRPCRPRTGDVRRWTFTRRTSWRRSARATPPS